MKVDKKTGQFIATFDIEVAKTLYQSGKSLAGIGAQLGVSKAAISYAFKRVGFSVNQSTPKVSKDDFIADINSGLSTPEIAVKYSMSDTAVRNRLKRYGISANIKVNPNTAGDISSTPRLSPAEAHKLAKSAPEYIVQKRARESSPEYKLAHSIQQKQAWQDQELITRHKLAMEAKWADKTYSDACTKELQGRVFPAGWHSGLVANQIMETILNEGSLDR